MTQYRWDSRWCFCSYGDPPYMVLWPFLWPVSMGMWDVLSLGPVGLLLTGGGDSCPCSPTQGLGWQSRRNPAEQVDGERSSVAHSVSHTPGDGRSPRTMPELCRGGALAFLPKISKEENRQASSLRPQFPFSFKSLQSQIGRLRIPAVCEPCLCVCRHLVAGSGTAGLT